MLFFAAIAWSWSRLRLARGRIPGKSNRQRAKLPHENGRQRRRRARLEEPTRRRGIQRVRCDLQSTVSSVAASRSRGAVRPRFAINFPPSPIRGRRECRAPDAPAAACAEVVVESTRVGQVTPESPGIPRAMVLRLIRDLPGDRALLPPSPALLIANLTPASGCQDHTTSPSASGAFVTSTIGVHRSPSLRP